LALAFVNSFSTLVLANVFLGLALSFYWPTIKSIGTNYASPQKRNEAFSLNRLADNLGLIIGVFLAGKLVSFTSNYRFLFLLQGFCCAILFVVIYLLLSETNSGQEIKPKTITNAEQNWQQVFRDKGLLIWLGTNVFFTVYESQLHTTMPLYLSKFMSTGVGSKGFLPETISLLFVVHTACNCLLQLPIGKLLNRLRRTYGLIISIVLWGGGFGLIWLAEFLPEYGIVWAVSALIFFSFALSTYVPSATSLMGDLAPESQRGLYFSLDSQCWAVGYLLGPSIGGWALDQSGEFAHSFWLVLGVTFVLGMATLFVLERIIYSHSHNSEMH
jgi:MFS family permease